MEIKKSDTEFSEEFQYKKAKKKAREIRYFYINLSLFCLIIPVIIGINLYFVPEIHWFWMSILGWGSGLLFHGLSIFGINPWMRNNWEERKIQQFIKEDIEREKRLKSNSNK